MYTIIDSLHADHINFSRLLNLLERQVVTLKDGGMPDLEIMLDTIDYLQNYADLYHHPREDLIFRYHLERSDVARAEVDELRRQHRALWESTNRVRLAIDGILHGDIVQRDVFIEQISAYVTQQMDHLNAEEGYILPLLRQLFEVQDWEQLNRSLPYRADPLFGPTVDQQYRALYTRILNVPDAVAESGLGA
ncbi:hemerythrin domain-containing protein [Methylolobus aquaticus]|uniref:hemerythrin domain-containing protein n=1 Tax=Methylotetracoccus oryzae TaxID=1919059 RepID=UPI00101E9A0D|nr:hemerythrin domain-containing protein [Methylotetracoccus oryzae]RYU57354.1 hypothetical protein EWI61_13055 [Methylolobus aquaticus]